MEYGTSSGPYLGTRCLQKLANGYIMEYPLDCEVLRRDHGSMDDLMIGANNLTTANEIRKLLVALLKTLGNLESHKN